MISNDKRMRNGRPTAWRRGKSSKITTERMATAMWRKSDPVDTENIPSYPDTIEELANGYEYGNFTEIEVSRFCWSFIYFGFIMEQWLDEAVCDMKNYVDHGGCVLLKRKNTSLLKVIR